MNNIDETNIYLTKKLTKIELEKDIVFKQFTILKELYLDISKDTSNILTGQNKLSNKFSELIKNLENCRLDDIQLNSLKTSFKKLQSEDIIINAPQQAMHLLCLGYKESACMTIGVCLEEIIKSLCLKKSIKFSRLEKMNADLKKTGLYNLEMRRKITTWTNLRNKAVHGVWTDYGIDDVKYLIEEIKNFRDKFLPNFKRSSVVVSTQDIDLSYTWIYNPNPEFKHQEILGKKDEELLELPEEVSKIKLIKQSVLNTGVSLQKKVFTTINKKTFEYELSVNPLFDVHANIIGISCLSKKI